MGRPPEGGHCQAIEQLFLLSSVSLIPSLTSQPPGSAQCSWATPPLSSKGWSWEALDDSHYAFSLPSA